MDGNVTAEQWHRHWQDSFLLAGALLLQVLGLSWSTLLFPLGSYQGLNLFFFGPGVLLLVYATSRDRSVATAEPLPDGDLEEIWEMATSGGAKELTSRKSPPHRVVRREVARIMKKHAWRKEQWKIQSLKKLPLYLIPAMAAAAAIYFNRNVPPDFDLPDAAMATLLGFGAGTFAWSLAYLAFIRPPTGVHSAADTSLPSRDIEEAPRS